jgi:uncharacterized protein YbaR (Trm112 family)
MPVNPIPHPPFDTALLAQLACPACLGELRLNESQLICTACNRSYPIVDGIPVLIAERAEMQHSAE